MLNYYKIYKDMKKNVLKLVEPEKENESYQRGTMKKNYLIVELSFEVFAYQLSKTQYREDAVINSWHKTCFKKQKIKPYNSSSEK